MGQAGIAHGDAGRDGQGRFAKGRSGNPKGRPPVPLEVRRAASPHTAEALAVLVEAMSSPSATLPMRSMAALGILQAAGGLKAVSATQPAERMPPRYRPPANALEAYVLAIKVLRDIAGDENVSLDARTKAMRYIQKTSKSDR